MVPELESMPGTFFRRLDQPNNNIGLGTIHAYMLALSLLQSPLNVLQAMFQAAKNQIKSILNTINP
jgi:hypothetical protein